jgi:hypothetical protein
VIEELHGKIGLYEIRKLQNTSVSLQLIAGLLDVE